MVHYNTLKGIEGLHTKLLTNYSLRATYITRMFKADVPEKIIAEKSGHKSLKALRVHGCTSSM